MKLYHGRILIFSGQVLLAFSLSLTRGICASDVYPTSPRENARPRSIWHSWVPSFRTSSSSFIKKPPFLNYSLFVSVFILALLGIDNFAGCRVRSNQTRVPWMTVNASCVLHATRWPSFVLEAAIFSAPVKILWDVSKDEALKIPLTCLRGILSTCTFQVFSRRAGQTLPLILWVFFTSILCWRSAGGPTLAHRVWFCSPIFLLFLLIVLFFVSFWNTSLSCSTLKK